MFIFNRVRIWFHDEIEKLKPLLRDAYKNIHNYQLNRTVVNETKMREAISQTTAVLNIFIDYIPAYKGKYIKLLEQQKELRPFDLIICFDRAVYELHLYAALNFKSGKYAQLPWSKELRILLDERQEIESDDSSRVTQQETFLTSGKPASRGTVQGPACVILSKDDFHRVIKGSILITPMTTPEFIEVASLISGLVTDRGGVVCHAAILAREFNIPCIVGCKNATETIRDGQLIRIDAISGVVMGCENV